MLILDNVNKTVKDDLAATVLLATDKPVLIA